MRHTDAGLAIPDFPLAFGHVIPPHWDPKIAIHFAHRVGALVASMLIVATAGHVFYHHRRRPDLVHPSILLLILLTMQITLGAYTVLTEKHYVINSLHVITGASVLVTSLVLALRVHHSRIVGRVPSQFGAIADSTSVTAPRAQSRGEGGTVRTTPPVIEGGPTSPTRTGARA
jgi:heme A synthase